MKLRTCLLLYGRPGIWNQRTTVEQKILEDYFDAGKSAIDFRKWQEALEDPKTGKQLDGPEDPFQDLKNLMEKIELG